VIVKELKISGFRPFYEEQTLKIEPDVTVLTGANDVGKSAILKILREFWNDRIWNDRNLDDVNEDRIMRSGVDPSDDASLCIVETYLVTPSDVEKYPELSNYRNWEIDVHYRAMESGHSKLEFRDENGMNVDEMQGVRYRLSQGIDLAHAKNIRSVMSSGSGLSRTEETLLSLAFGSKEERQKLERQNSNIQNTLRDRANDRLASKLKPVKPDAMGLTLKVDYHSRNPLSFIVALEDRQGGRAGPHLRGAGNQKLIALMLDLLEYVSDPSPMILVYDEPENSLHADAQHALRRMLEGVSQYDHIQVVYATHSPAMINPARPKSLRLISRESSADGVATTKINNKPYADENFQLIRSSLGMSPADSLLYAPITIIIEGATESLGLNRLFQRLIDESEDEQYHDLETLIGFIHFLPAGGSSFVRWAKLARSQGCKIIIFVDGDQIKLARKVVDELNNVTLIHFDETKEIEDIVPREVYFEALDGYVASNNPQSSKVVSKEAFEAWEAQHEFHERFLFSKRVEKWYEELFDYGLEKAEVMDSAIKRAKLEDIDMSKIDELIDAIRKAADNLP